MSATSTFTPPRSAIRRLATARFISLVGSSAAFTALGYLIFQRTAQSTTWLSLALFVTFGAMAIFTPIGGALGDRLDRRKLLIASDLLGALGFVVLAFVQAPGWMLAVAFVTAVVEAPFRSVSSAAVPNLAGGEDQLSWANGLISIGSNLGFLIGPVLGGLLIGLLARDNTPEQLRLAAYVVFGFNALSFMASAVIVRSIHGRFSEDRDATAERDTGMRVGVRYLVHDRVLRTITLAWIVFLFGAGATLVAELPLAEAFGTGAVGYGALSSMWAGGAAVGAFLGSRYLTARREPAALVAGTATMGIGLGLISVAPWFAMVLPFMLFAGTGEGFSGVAEQSVLQRFTPDEVRSRVISASEGAIVAVFALSFLAGGPLVELLGVRRAYFVAGMSGIAAALVMATIVPQIRARESAQKSLDQG